MFLLLDAVHKALKKLSDQKYHASANPPLMVSVLSALLPEKNTIDDADHIINLKNLILYIH